MEGTTEKRIEEIVEEDGAAEAAEAPAAAAPVDSPNMYKLQAHVQEAGRYLAKEEMLAAQAQDSLRTYWGGMLKAIADRTAEVTELVKDVKEGKDRSEDMARIPLVLEHIAKDFAAIGNDTFELLQMMSENRRIADSLRGALAASSRPRPRRAPKAPEPAEAAEEAAPAAE